jgi:hypothetical protein
MNKWKNVHEILCDTTNSTDPLMYINDHCTILLTVYSDLSVRYLRWSPRQGTGYHKDHVPVLFSFPEITKPFESKQQMASIGLVCLLCESGTHGH